MSTGASNRRRGCPRCLTHAWSGEKRAPPGESGNQTHALCIQGCAALNIESRHCKHANNVLDTGMVQMRL